MKIEKREVPEKKEKPESTNQTFRLSKSAKTTLSVGVVLSLTPVSLAVVVHSLGNLDLTLSLRHRR